MTANITSSLTLLLSMMRAYDDLIVFLITHCLAAGNQLLHFSGTVLLCACGERWLSFTGSLAHHTLLSQMLHSLTQISCIIPLFQEPLYFKRQHDCVLSLLKHLDGTSRVPKSTVLSVSSASG